MSETATTETATAATTETAVATATTATATATTATSATTETNAPVRPDYIPEKFWKDGAVDHEALAKSYTSLETKFHTARTAVVDVPESPEAYQLKPEKLPDGIEWSEEVDKRFRSVFHEKGVSADAAAAIATTFVEMEAENYRQLDEAYKKQLADGQAALKKEWGASYDQKITEIKGAVQRLGFDPADVSLFSNPQVVKFMGKVVGALSPDSIPAAKGGVATGATFSGTVEEATRIMTDKTHPEYELYHQGERSVIDKVRKALNGG